MDKLFFIVLRALVLGTVYAVYFAVLIWDFFSGRLKWPLLCVACYLLLLFIPCEGFFPAWLIHLMFGVTCFVNGYLFIKTKKDS